MNGESRMEKKLKKQKSKGIKNSLRTIFEFKTILSNENFCLAINAQSVLSSMVATNHMWLLSTGNVTSVTKDLDF